MEVIHWHISLHTQTAHRKIPRRIRESPKLDDHPKHPSIQKTKLTSSMLLRWLSRRRSMMRLEHGEGHVPLARGRRVVADPDEAPLGAPGRSPRRLRAQHLDLLALRNGQLPFAAAAEVGDDPCRLCADCLQIENENRWNSMRTLVGVHWWLWDGRFVLRVGK